MIDHSMGESWKAVKPGEDSLKPYVLHWMKQEPAHEACYLKTCTQP